MRAILTLGTRGCRTAIEDALRDHLDPVLLIAPAEPALLGPALDTAGLDEELELLADLVLVRARAKARRVREQEVQGLTGVFDADPAEGKAGAVHGQVLDGPLATTLATVLEAHDIQEVWMSREALELLDQAGVDTAGAISQAGAELEAR